MRLRVFLAYLGLLSLSGCTKSGSDYDNAEEFGRAKLPAYSETGAFTLGCHLGPQVWTVLGSHEEAGSIGYPWRQNSLTVEGAYSRPPLLIATGQMTGVRDSRPFYDLLLSLTFSPTDTLGGLHLLGADTARVPLRNRPLESMRALDYLTFREYQSQARRPVRLLIRRLDQGRRIVSGTFEGCLYAQPGGPGGPDSLRVTDGRFDLKY